MDKCPYCSFDPTNANDFCEEHRPGNRRPPSTPVQPLTEEEIRAALAPYNLFDRLGLITAIQSACANKWGIQLSEKEGAKE